MKLLLLSLIIKKNIFFFLLFFVKLSFFLLFYTVIIGNLIAYNLYAHLLKHNSATLMSLAGFTIPIYVSLMGYFLLGEPVTWMLVVAAVCMLVGVGMFYFDDVLRDFLKKKQLGGV